MKPQRLSGRAWLAFAHDVCAAAVVWGGLYWLRFGADLGAYYGGDLVASLGLVIPLQVGIFLAFGLYRGLWRYASLADLKKMVLAAGFGALLIPLAIVMFRLDVVVPRSVLILYPILLVAVMAGSRFAYRLWKEHRLYSPLAALGEPVLILGAGEAGALLVRELERSHQWRVVGLLDDDPTKRGRLIRNVQVLGPIADVRRWAERFGVQQVIIAMPAADHSSRRRATGLCGEAGLKTLTVPAYEDLISGRVPLSTVREVELDDLLGRDPVALDDAGLHEWLAGRVVMITGAGGSIGAEICRQVARYEPSRLVLVELSEYALYRVEQALGDEFPALPTAAVICDVKNAARVAEVLQTERPSIVFHAAAYKHVPLMEEGNAWEALRNNAWGTHILARAAVAVGVEKFVLVSTDKAVNPTNVMGASKRLAELLCQRFAGTPTRFVVVRFGNVAGSAGSVIPRFREQIARGGPVTVTHPEVTRYFMSLTEATQLVLQAGMMGGDGDVLVLDMGEPVRIVDLARELIRLSGHDPEQIGIRFTGLRPGEKLYEEPLGSEERTVSTPHPKLRVARGAPPSPGLPDAALEWLARDEGGSLAHIRAMLARLLPEYRPAGAATAPLPSPAPSAPTVDLEAERLADAAVPDGVGRRASAAIAEAETPTVSVAARAPHAPLPARDPAAAELLLRRNAR